jgi:hypothetical protein
LNPPAPDRVAAVVAAAAAAVPSVVEWTRRIAAVPAPTGDEGERSAFVRSLFAEAGLRASVDDLGDVVATIPGRQGGVGTPAVLLAAHIDTVFARETPLPITVDGTRMAGPGIGDNSVGVAAVLGVPGVLRAAGEDPWSTSSSRATSERRDWVTCAVSARSWTPTHGSARWSRSRATTSAG